MQEKALDTNPVDITTLISYRVLVFSGTLARWAAREYLHNFDLKLPEWRIISIVGARGPISANEVSEIISIDKAWISRTIPALVKRNLVRLQADAQDRRRKMLTLTPKGAEIHKKLSRISRARQDRLFQSLKATDVAKLQSILATLQAEAEKMLIEQETQTRRHPTAGTDPE